MSVMGFQKKKFGWGWVGGWGELYPIFLGIFGIVFTLQSPLVVTMKDLRDRTNKVEIEISILERRDWSAIPRESSTNITRQALTWIPQCKRKMGRPTKYLDTKPGCRHYANRAWLAKKLMEDCLEKMEKCFLKKVLSHDSRWPTFQLRRPCVDRKVGRNTSTSICCRFTVSSGMRRQSAA